MTVRSRPSEGLDVVSQNKLLPTTKEPELGTYDRETVVSYCMIQTQIQILTDYSTIGLFWP